MAIKKIKRSSFGKAITQHPVPNLNTMQLESYQRFWTEELTKILSEFSPVDDSAGNKWKVTIGPKFDFQIKEAGDPTKALVTGGSYTAPLYIDIAVENLITKEKKKQKVFAAKVPLITEKGNFIINGVQKIVVGQLVKSPGVIFTRALEKGVPIYTAKIIPMRGIWIDLMTSPTGAIYARIDRKKKFPATQLIKLFDVIKEKDIKDLFRDVDIDPKMSYVDATLEKDSAFGLEDAVDSVYKKIRPGDIASIEQGKRYILSLFEDEAKYDFGSVGRYKFNNRLDVTRENSKGFDYKKTISLQDIVDVMRELIKMAVENSPADDIDALSNRRVRAVGEWMSNTFKAGLSRVVKNTKDKMLTHEDDTFTPAQLVNMRPLAAMVEDFFNTSQLSRMLDQTNAISEVDDRSFLTAAGPGGLTRERASFDVRDVHKSHYGRICPINTSEGQAFGLNINTAIYARINRLGFLETPYFKVKSAVEAGDPSLVGRIAREDVVIKGSKIIKAGQLISKDLQEKVAAIDTNMLISVPLHVSQDMQWLDAQAELKYTIAEYVDDVDELGHFQTESIGARKKGDPFLTTVNDIDYIDVAPNQILSLSSCMVPFVKQSDGYRVLMATNQQGQALPLVRPEAPIVATGFEQVVARDSGYVTYAPFDGVVSSADGAKVTIKSKDGEEQTYSTLKYLPSNSHSAINQNVRVKVGEEIKKGDILIEGFGIHDGEFAIGQNVRVAFMPFKGYNFEDSIIFSERLVQRDKFTSVHIHEFTCDVHETRIGNEEITRDIPNVQSDKLNKLDEKGIVHVGAYVQSGDILVGKITPKADFDITPEDKLIRVLFGDYSREVKDSSLYLEHGLSGKVISIRRFSRNDGHPLPSDVIERVHIWLAITRKIKPGDKVAGRHGNKSIVSVVLPVEDMPYTEDGQPIDVIFNPLGVIGRMNLGQLLETHLGLVCEKRGVYAITQPLNDIDAETVQQELVEAGFPDDGKVVLYDGQTGEPYDRPIVVGHIYLNKLYHLVDDKIHARSTGPYSLVTQQPLGGRSHYGGQRFGEMEVWALEAYGAAYALQEMLTIKSDDRTGRDTAFEAIIKSKPIMSPNLPESFIVLANELTALGIKVNADVTASDDYNQMDEQLALSADIGTLK